MSDEESLSKITRTFAFVIHPADNKFTLRFVTRLKAGGIWNKVEFLCYFVEKFNRNLFSVFFFLMILGQ